MKRTHAIAALSLLAVIAGAFALSHTEQDAHSAEEAKTVTTLIATDSIFQPETDFSGFVSGTRSADLAPRGSGFVVRLLKEEGDRVSQGETIALLEASEIQAGRMGALDALRTIDSTVSRTARYYDQKVDEAKTALDHAEENYRSGSASKQDVDTAEEALKSAKRLRDAEISGAKANRSEAAGNALVSAALEDNLIIRAPFSGIVTRRYLSIGAIASPERPVYAIASPDATEILISIPSATARSLSAGTPVRVISDIGETEIPGRIFSLAPGSDAMTQQSLARIRADKPSDTLRIGDHARVRFPVGEAHTALMIPESAIERIYDEARIAVVENGTVRYKSVVLGQGRDTDREIISGIEPGEHVVIEGIHSIRSGQSVTERYVER